MRLKPLNRSIAVTMAFLMFFSSVGFTMDFHFCSGQLKSFSIIGEASSCHAPKKSCPHHPKMEMDETKKNDCCSNTTVEVEDLDEEYTMSSDIELTESNIKFLSTFIYTFSILSIPQEIQCSFFESENPLPLRDIYVLLESYLL